MIPIGDDNPARRTAVVTLVLIASCTGVWLWQQSLPPDLFDRAALGLGMIPTRLIDGYPVDPSVHPVLPPVATLFSSMFMHGGWMHLIGNMLYLWIFGNNVEDAMGRGRFLAFYLLSGLVAALVQAFTDPHSVVPMIGASGAVSGVLGAYLLLYPAARVVVLLPLFFIFTTVRLPAVLVLGGWFAMQLISYKGGGDGVAWMAHIGGFLAGMVLVLYFKRDDVPLFGRAPALRARNTTYRGF